MKIGLISDTHGFLDPKVFEYFKACDEIWHAGDIGDTTIIQDLNQFKPTRFVSGNIDNGDIRKLVPSYHSFDVEGKCVMIVHIPGRLPYYTKEIKSIWQKHKVPDIMICGHSHILKVEQDKKNNLLYINPGAAGKHKIRTIIRFDLHDGQLSNMQAIELGKRGAL